MNFSDGPLASWSSFDLASITVGFLPSELRRKHVVYRNTSSNCTLRFSQSGMVVSSRARHSSP